MEIAAATTASTFTAWELSAPGEAPRRAWRARRPPDGDEVLVRVAGCGVCHTDLGFAYDGVKTRAPLPLVLGHEISGVVEEAGARYAHLAGLAVVVPAVLPCGGCAACLSGRSGVCKRQVMPGNDVDGGFATHVFLPGRGICAVPGAPASPDVPIGSAPGLTLRHLSVVADAVSTAYQAVLRSGVDAGDLAIVVGLGGVGGFAAQVAADRGAVVVGLDVDPRRRASPRGVTLALDPGTLPGKELKKRILAFAKENGLSDLGWTVLECSGSAAGQKTAFSLLGPAATLMVVGYTMAEVELRLSNLMAFDARALGNWGCAPEHYPQILEKVLSGKIDVASTCEIRPLSSIAQTFEDVRAHRTDKRLILAPDLAEASR